MADHRIDGTHCDWGILHDRFADGGEQRLVSLPMADSRDLSSSDRTRRHQCRGGRLSDHPLRRLVRTAASTYSDAPDDPADRLARRFGIPQPLEHEDHRPFTRNSSIAPLIEQGPLVGGEAAPQ